MTTIELEAGNSPNGQKPQLEISPEEQNAKLIVSGILFAVTFLGVLNPPGGTNDKGQTNMSHNHFVPYVICNTIASTASSLYIVQIVGRKASGVLFNVAVLGIAVAYGVALVAISEHSQKKFAIIMPIVTLVVLFAYRYVRTQLRCC